MAKLTLRVEFGPEQALGPGKIRLLELVRDTGSISAAGRAMNMSYRRAWLLIDSMNRCFSEPVVATQLGGRAGGGAALTALGAAVVEHYRAIERAAARAAARHLALLSGKLAGGARRRST